MSSILPKGIVVNSPRAEDAIENIGAKPLDLAQIAEYWKVYTTTKRRLLDPTAERLENYWWRIWGSQRRELEAATVARLFRHISHGPTVLPLRGPDNRDEGTPLLENQALYATAASSETTLQRQNENRPRTTASSSTSRVATAMPPPILKKTRGPSTTGPRPTARFVSPHESEKEMGSSSSVDSISGPVAQPPPSTRDGVKSDGKPSSSTKKKPGLVSSTATKKKRPVISRRQSSQSSAGSKSTDSTGSTQSFLQRTSPSTSEQKQARLKKATHSKVQEKSSPEFRSSGRTSTPKIKATTNSVDPELYVPRKLGERGGQGTISGEATQNMGISYMSQSKDADRGQILHKTLSSHSSGNCESMEAVREVKSAASLAPTLTDATAQLTLDDPVSHGSGHPPARTSPGTERSKDKGPKGLQQADMFAKRPVPPVVGPVVSEPTGLLSRSKSQLTDLLEKDRAKSAGQVSPKIKR